MTVSFPYQEIVAHARAHSPFYRESYKGLPEDPKLSDLPVLDEHAYWDAHQRDPREVLTGPIESGIVIGSGGTTGAPKFSYYDHADWDRGSVVIAMGFEHIGLRTGDRVANLFASGELYGSFMGVTAALKMVRGVRVLQFPISHLAPNPNVVRILRHFRCNVVAGVPTRLLRLFSYMEAEGIDDVPIERAIFAAESFFPTQRAATERRFPGIQIKSVGYASVDAGMMAYADSSCAPDEHRTLGVAGVLELLEEDGDQPITETGRPGRLAFTNLTRRFQPVIRYPVGDLAQWVEPPAPDARGVTADGRKFRLLGRTQQSPRIAHMNFEVSDLRKILAPFGDALDLRQFQIQIEQLETRDRLTLRLVANAPRETLFAAESEILDAIYRFKPALLRVIADSALEPIILEWVRAEELLVNERTGKLRDVVDLRREPAPLTPLPA